jgi:hypothetical protein
MSTSETPTLSQRFQPDTGNLTAGGISCRQCKHKSVYKPTTPSERLICLKSRYQTSCSFARGDDDMCGLKGKWFERSAFV